MDYYIITYGIALIALAITGSASLYINSTYKKYSKIFNKKRITGAEAARIILDKNGLKDIYVVETGGTLTDHYDPSRKVIRLSKSIYNDESISSVAVAAHECGHAIQDKDGYLFLRIRSSLVPLVNFSSSAGYIVIFRGILMQSLNLIWLGIILEGIILLFQLITLPVEIDASKRGLKAIEEYNLLNEIEMPNAKSVLIAAALTYVAGVAASMLEILRLILLFGRRDKR